MTTFYFSRKVVTNCVEAVWQMLYRLSGTAPSWSWTFIKSVILYLPSQPSENPSRPFSGILLEERFTDDNDDDNVAECDRNDDHACTIHRRGSIKSYRMAYCTVLYCVFQSCAFKYYMQHSLSPFSTVVEFQLYIYLYCWALQITMHGSRFYHSW